jgi:hypothetical protein
MGKMKGREEINVRQKLLHGMPYTKKALETLEMGKIRILASMLDIESWQRTKDEIIKSVLKNQKELDSIDERIEHFCEMCGHFTAIREKAHIIAEGRNGRTNTLMLCPTCHRMFDTRLKIRIYNALNEYGVSGLPESWTKSIFDQANEASMLSPKRKNKSRK